MPINSINPATTSIEPILDLPSGGAAQAGDILFAMRGGNPYQVTQSATPAPVLTVHDVTAPTMNMVTNSSYITDRASLVTLTMPITAAIGDMLIITGKGTGGWQVNQNGGQTIYLGDAQTATGSTGYIASTNFGDSITLECITANTDWRAVSMVGAILYNH